MIAPEALPIWVEGAFQDRGAPVFGAEDRGLLYGLGAFETVWIRDRRPVGLARHLARLGAGLAALDIQADLAPLGAALATLAGRLDPGAEAAGRLLVSGGPVGGPSLRLAALRSLPAGLDGRRAGLRGAPVGDLARILPTVKSLAWLPSVLAQRAVPPGVEPFFVDPAGLISEGATCNLFLRRQGRWFTPPAGPALPGVARAVVIERAAQLEIAVIEAPIPAAWLAEAEEAFVTNALLPLAPLLAFAGQTLPPPSDLQQTLRAGYLGAADAC